MSIKGLFAAIDISATGLTAQRTKLNIIASNIANAESTRTEKGGPYKRQQVILSPAKRAKFLTILKEEFLRVVRTNKWHIDNEAYRVAREEYAQGVKIDGILEDEKPSRLIYEPDHPDADENGFVAYPNINMITEMVNMMVATRAYEANVTAISAAKSMMQQALEI